MEKPTPHCPLAQVKRLVNSGHLRITRSAQDSAELLGCGFTEVQAVVLALQSSDFYKSMTSHADHRVWQDVYRPVTAFGQLYVKLTVIEAVVVVSFKEL
jgi:motility quorum-sensing regulator / GCU-specific mRNA interferase toxin